MVTAPCHRTVALGWILTAQLLYGSCASAADLIIESSAVPLSPYLQQQVVYTIHLYRKSHLQLGYFLTPEVPEVLIRAADPRPPVIVTREGDEYELLEQRYLLFPQRSGKIELPAPVFSSRHLFVRGEPLTLDVQPPPSGEHANSWIVAEDLQLNEEWNAPDSPWRVGDPLERRITVQATGMTAAQLPEINALSQPGLRLQNLPGELHEEVTDNGLRSSRVTRLRLIAERSGEWELAPVRIRWWNSNNNSAVVSVLPGRRLTIFEALPQTESIEISAPVADPPISGEWTDAEHWRAPGIATVASLLSLPMIWLAYRLQLFPRLTQYAFRLHLCLRLLLACLRQSPSEIRVILQRGVELRSGRRGAFSLISLARQMERPETAEVLLKLDATLYSASKDKQWRCRGTTRHLLSALNRPPGKASERITIDLPPLWRAQSTRDRRE